MENEHREHEHDGQQREQPVRIQSPQSANFADATHNPMHFAGIVALIAGPSTAQRWSDCDAARGLTCTPLATPFHALGLGLGLRHRHDRSGRCVMMSVPLAIAVGLSAAALVRAEPGHSR